MAHGEAGQKESKGQRIRRNDMKCCPLDMTQPVALTNAKQLQLPEQNQTSMCREGPGVLFFAEELLTIDGGGEGKSFFL